MRYVTFNTNLSIYRKKKLEYEFSKCILSQLSHLLSGLLCSEYSPDILLTFSIHQNPSHGFISFHILSIAVTPATCMLCLVVIQIWCHLLTKSVSSWLPIILIILSNDIQLNPGPQVENNLLNFRSWNLNSLSKKEFERVRLIGAQNSIFHYDLTSICETSLTTLQN